MTSGPMQDGTATPDGMPTQDGMPDWLLERYRLGELAAADQERVSEALARTPDLRARLDELDRSSLAVLQEHPPAALVAAVRRSTAAPRPRHHRLLAPLAAAAIVTLALAGGALWTPGGAPLSKPDETRVKGIAPYLLLYRKAAADVERLAPAALARQHDVVQLAYQAGARRYGVILSVDGRGVVTRHLPLSGAAAVALTPGVPVPLAQSYELDDAPGFERFVLVAGDEPFAVEQVEGAVRRQYVQWGAEANERRLDLPDSMDQFSLVLRKETSR